MRNNDSPANLLTFGTLFAALAVSVCSANINSNGQEGLQRTISAKTMGAGKMVVGAGVNYAQDRAYVTGLDGSDDIYRISGADTFKTYIESAKMLSTNFYIGIGATSWLDFAAMVPLYYDWAGFGSVRDRGLGDVEVSAKILYPPLKDRRVYHQAYYLAITIPVGMKNRGLFPKHPYFMPETDQGVDPAKTFYSSSLPGIKPMMLWDIDIGSAVPSFQFDILVNFGGVFTTDAELNNTLVGSIALKYAPVEVLDIFIDAYGETRLSNFTSSFSLAKDPMYVSAGIKINTPAGVYLVMAGDLCFSPFFDETKYQWETDGYEYKTGVAPRWGFSFQFGWEGFLSVQDDDRDGLKNDLDRCPKDAEDVDGFEDGDGCPEPDNDNDGIDDLKDKCPDKAEDHDGFQDDDGCPEADNDGDGIGDLQDQCPKIAEDFDGFEDRDGCPEDDNDRDGVADSIDKCRNDPEDVDKFEDNDGCPDIDNDNDGITDLKDKCPNEPEVINDVNDEDGCPDEKKVEPRMPQQQILKGVNFKTGSSEMTFDSYKYIDPVIKLLQEYPSVEIEIRGHTDSIGKYEENMALSQIRAESVRKYIVSKGIDAGRLRAMGFGPSSPIADNRTAAGRSENRRIEIVRIK
jgi:outer membrane protein OmpA-like peptidoglycan-associated protein